MPLQALINPDHHVEIDAKGHAIIKGTVIEVHRIAALSAGGMPVDAILADYPSLTADHVDMANAYAEAHPTTETYPHTTAKAAMRAGDLSALDPDLVR